MTDKPKEVVWYVRSRRSATHFTDDGASTLCGRGIGNRKPPEGTPGRFVCAHCRRAWLARLRIVEQCIGHTRYGKLCARPARGHVGDNLPVCGMHLIAYKEARRAVGKDAALYRLEHGRYPEGVRVA